MSAICKTVLSEDCQYFEISFTTDSEKIKVDLIGRKV